MEPNLLLWPYLRICKYGHKSKFGRVLSLPLEYSLAASEAVAQTSVYASALLAVGCINQYAKAFLPSLDKANRDGHVLCQWSASLKYLCESSPTKAPAVFHRRH